MNITDSYIQSSTGKDRIRVRTWRPEGKVKAILQIAHGVAEHVERYDDFARFLNQSGIMVVAGDHLGHGKSITNVQGWFAESDGWFHVVRDLKSIFDANYDESLPYFMLGHSMGSFLLRTFLIKYPQLPLAGAIISGTGVQPTPVLKAGIAVCNIEGKRHGFDKVSKLVNDLAFGSYNKRTEQHTTHDWLSRDEEQVSKYLSDSLCGFDVTTGLARDMMGGISYIQKVYNLELMNKSLPVLFISGDMDPVGNYGAGVRKAYTMFRNAGMSAAEIKLYPGGRHEMLNETNRQEVYDFILDWLKTHISIR